MLPDTEWSDHCRRISDEEAAGWLTPKQARVLTRIACHFLAGDHEPTVAQLAVEAHCDPRTVRRARAAGQKLGLLHVKPQYDVIDGVAWQKANRYTPLVPHEPVMPKPKPPPGQNVRPRQASIRKKEEAVEKWITTPASAPELLIARQKVMNARLQVRYSPRTII